MNKKKREVSTKKHRVLKQASTTAPLVPTVSHGPAHNGVSLSGGIAVSVLWLDRLTLRARLRQPHWQSATGGHAPHRTHLSSHVPQHRLEERERMNLELLASKSLHFIGAAKTFQKTRKACIHTTRTKKQSSHRAWKTTLSQGRVLTPKAVTGKQKKI